MTRFRCSVISLRDRGVVKGSCWITGTTKRSTVVKYQVDHWRIGVVAQMQIFIAVALWLCSTDSKQLSRESGVFLCLRLGTMESTRFRWTGRRRLVGWVHTCVWYQDKGEKRKDERYTRLTLEGIGL